MNKLKVLLPLALLFCLTYIACNKDDITTLGPGVTVIFTGRIMDETGEAITGAQVRAGDETTSTDDNGVFRLKPVRQNAQNAILYVSKFGYFEFSRAYQVRDNALQTVTIQLLKKEQAGTVNPVSGGVIDVPGGAKLTFPANAFANKSGSLYPGAVNVFAHYLDPTDPGLTYKMPGDLRGINKDGNEQILSTFGMMGVELEDASGQSLQVASGIEVEIRIPIPSGQAAAVPSEIPLWHYDTEFARWVEEGSAQKIGNEYVGKVKHFSFWNCDFLYDRVTLTGSVYLDDLQHPLADVEVQIAPADNNLGWGCGHGTTDMNGNFSGGVPKDIELEIRIIFWGQCFNNPVYIQTIGPFSSDATLPPIIFTNTTMQTISIAGKMVDCAGQGIENGYSKIVWGGLEQIAFPDANGDFEVHIPTCNSNQADGTIVAFDLINLLQSSTQTFTTPPNNVMLGDIQACTVPTEFVQYTLDGQSVTNFNPFVFIGLQDSTMMTGELYTFINAFDPQQNNISFQFKNNNQLGTFAPETFYVAPYEADVANSNLNITVTTAPANVGDLIGGSFGSSFVDVQGNTHTVSGSFKIIRRQ